MLQTVFGFTEFRPGQFQVISRLLAGRSALAVFPTGSGKSLCFQLPALLLGGLTLVVSPLLALMKDQVDYLRCRGIAAARLDSTLTHTEASSVLRQVRSRQVKILYVSPERVGTETFRALVLPGSVSLFVVDESHCISEWGHNFRPEYLKLARFAREVRAERVLGLTATATPQVAADIAAAFGIAPDDIVRTGFYRPNLHLAITPAAPDRKLQVLVQRLRTRPRGPTIVYVTHQETAELVAEHLCQAGFPAHSYHAGMKDEDRQEIQDQFMASAAGVIVATIAFGMGVDKSNIRYIYHYNLPKSPEGYSQEIGRAGRDGEPSHCELLFCPEDVLSLENFAYGDTPAWTSVAGLVIDLFSRSGPALEFSLYELCNQYDIRLTVLKTLLTYLELDGFVFERGPHYQTYRFRRVGVPSGGSSAHTALMGELFRCARFGITWYTLSVDEAASQLRRPREELVSALVEAQEAGTIELEPCDSRVRYRRIQQPGQLDQLVNGLMDRLLQRETREIARLHQVLQLATHDGCQTNWLASLLWRAADGPVRPLPVVPDGPAAGHAAQQHEGAGPLHHPFGDRSPGDIPGTAGRAVGAGKVLVRHPVAVDDRRATHVARAFRRLPNRAVSVRCQRRPPAGRFAVPTRLLGRQDMYDERIGLPMRDCVIHEFIPPRSWYARREPPESDEVLAQRREVEKALLRRLFSPAGWDGLTPCQRRLVDMVMGEIVPGRKGWRRGYGGGVRLIIGGVPGRDQAQIPFWVNGGRLPRRSGHCLVLPTRNSFVVRAGYMRVNESEQECLAKVPSFLQDVYDIAEVLGVDLVGTSGDRPDGIGMEDMVKLGLSLYSYYSLCWLQVRGLPRQTYLHEWYRHFADGDRRPPSDNGGICCEAAVEPDARELLERSVALGITQADLAFILGVAPTLVCMFKHGRRRWPPGFLHRIKTFLDAAETAVVGTIDGPWQPLEDPPRRSRTRSEA